MRAQSEIRVLTAEVINPTYIPSARSTSPEAKASLPAGTRVILRRWFESGDNGMLITRRAELLDTQTLRDSDVRRFVQNLVWVRHADFVDVIEEHSTVAEPESWTEFMAVRAFEDNISPSAVLTILFNNPALRSAVVDAFNRAEAVASESAHSLPGGFRDQKAAPEASVVRPMREEC